jgi:hypothetical protein
MCHYGAITLLYKVMNKYPAVLVYSDHVAKDLDKMCATCVLHPIAQSSVNFFTLINAVIKSFDNNCARTIANVVITDQTSLTRGLSRSS